jgi:hypothetical protein
MDDCDFEELDDSSTCFLGAARKRIARRRCGRVGEGPEDVEPYPLL